MHPFFFALCRGFWVCLLFWWILPRLENHKENKADFVKFTRAHRHLIIIRDECEHSLAAVLQSQLSYHMIPRSDFCLELFSLLLARDIVCLAPTRTSFHHQHTPSYHSSDDPNET